MASNDFSDALHKLVKGGRGKHRNIILVGPADLRKTFLLDPVCSAFPRTFGSPGSSR